MSNDFELPVKADTSETGQDSKENKKDIKEETKEEPSKYTKDELIRVFDDLIFAGVYTEVIGLRNGKLKVGFRTRTAEEIEKITMQLDTTTANLVSTVNDKRALLTLQYALTNYQGKDLSTSKIEEKATYVNRLPAPVVGALMKALQEFDEKVYAACQEGEENF